MHLQLAARMAQPQAVLQRLQVFRRFLDCALAQAGHLQDGTLHLPPRAAAFATLE